MTATAPFKIINWQDIEPRPAHGQEIRFIIRANAEEGFRSSLDYTAFFTLNPGERSDAHAHDVQEKIYYVIAGSCDVRLDEHTATVRAGDSFFVPINVEHEIINNASEPVQYMTFVNKIIA